MKHALALRALVLSVLALFALSLTDGQRAGAQSYSYVDLGNVGSYQRASINNAGQIVASFGSGYTIRAFIITPLDTNGDGKPDTWYVDTNNDGINDLMTLLPLPSGYTGNIAHAVNIYGQVAGETRLNATNQVTQLATISSPGGTTETVTKTQSVASGINDNGVLAGSARTTNGQSYNAAIWQKTVTKKGTYWTQTLLGAPTGYTASNGWAINNDGAVCGRLNSSQSTLAAYIWLPSAHYGLPQGWTVLPSIGGMGGDPWAINNNGQMAGISAGHAALWLLQPAFGLAAGVQDLNPVGTVFTRSEARSMNNAPNGVLSVVGEMNDGVSLASAFLWRSDTMQAVDLNTVTVGIPTGWVLWYATGINDAGVIVGYSLPVGSTDYTQSHLFVLIPTS